MQKSSNPPKEVKRFVKGFYRTLMSIGSLKFYKEFCKLYTIDASLKSATSGKLIEKTGSAYLNRIALTKVILDEICVVYNCSAADVTKSNKRGRIMEAKVMYVVLLKQHLNLSLGDIKEIVHINKSNISRMLIAYNKKINEVSVKYDAEYSKNLNTGFFENIETVNKIVYNFKNKNKKNKP
jgi:hypothetical protein